MDTHPRTRVSEEPKIIARNESGNARALDQTLKLLVALDMQYRNGLHQH
jgi:hypothetical protein